MKVQFQCPSCQSPLQADATQEMAEALCPHCGTQFMVDTRTAFLPMVQAVAVTAQSPSPVQERRRRAMEAQKRSDRRRFHALAVGCIVMAGGIYFMGLHLKRRVDPPEETSWSSGKAAQVMAVARMQEEEVRLVEEAEARRSAASQRERLARMEAEEREARAAQRATLVSLVSQEVFNGDRAAAEAMVTEMEAVQQEIITLFNDGIPGNEPSNAKELEQMILTRLLPRFTANPVIMRAAQNRAPQDLARNLLRRAPANEGPGSIPEIFRNGKYDGSGTGFWVSGDGWLITNHHVVGSQRKVDVRLVNGKICEAQVIRTDEKNDLALLKADVASPAWLPVSKGEKELGLGRMVFTIGYPNAVLQGLEPKFTDGRISSQTGLNDDKAFYQTSVPVQPGNSGGPLIDFGSGWVVGVISLRLERSQDGRSAQSVSYAVKGSLLNGFILGTQEAAASISKRPAASLKPGDAGAITERTRLATALVLVTR